MDVIRVILLTILLVFLCDVNAEPDISAEKYMKLSTCIFVGDIAASVQQIRHEGDTLAMFESKAPQLLRQDKQPDFLIDKIISIGREVYDDPIEFKRSEIFVIYYNQCINDIDIENLGTPM